MTLISSRSPLHQALSQFPLCFTQYCPNLQNALQSLCTDIVHVKSNFGVEMTTEITAFFSLVELGQHFDTVVMDHFPKLSTPCLHGARTLPRLPTAHLHICSCPT
jgi:hypothetical protein